MRKLLLILFLNFCFFLTSAQENKIPPIEFLTKYELPNYIKNLASEDENSLMMSIGFSGYWQNGTISKFIVYQNNGKILKFDVYLKNQLSKPTVKKRNLSKRKYKYYWKFLYENFANNNFKIDKAKLNINEKPLDDNTVSKIVISDGVEYQFNIYQKNNRLAYSSYSPETYINEKFPGYEEREKLVKLITDFDKLYKEN